MKPTSLESFRKRKRDEAQTQWVETLDRAAALDREGKTMFAQALLDKARKLRADIKKYEAKPAPGTVPKDVKVEFAIVVHADGNANYLHLPPILTDLTFKVEKPDA